MSHSALLHECIGQDQSVSTHHHHRYARIRLFCSSICIICSSMIDSAELTHCSWAAKLPTQRQSLIAGGLYFDNSYYWIYYTRLCPILDESRLNITILVLVARARMTTGAAIRTSTTNCRYTPRSLTRSSSGLAPPRSAHSKRNISSSGSSVEPESQV